jgi:hypothetical protein
MEGKEEGNKCRGEFWEGDKEGKKYGGEFWE